jgi:hypothetical protein
VAKTKPIASFATFLYFWQAGSIDRPTQDSRKNNFTFVEIDPFMLRYRSMNSGSRPS